MSIYVEILIRAPIDALWAHALGDLSGKADVREWYDDDAECFRIVVDVSNTVWGPLVGYRGSFNVEWRQVTAAQIPSHVLPQRQERRD